MPVLPTFEPQGAPGQTALRGIAGYEQGRSIMERAAESRRADQVEEMKRAEFELNRPVQVAEARAKIAGLGDQIAIGAQMNDLLATAKTEMPSIRQEWIDSMKINDPVARLSQQDYVLGKADKFAALKDVGAEIKQWHDVYAQSAINQRTRDAIAGRAETANLQAETQKTIQGAKDEAAKALTDQKAAHAKELEQLRVDKDKEIAALRAKTSETVATTRAGATVDAAKERANRTYELGWTMERLDEAVKAGDDESAKIYRDRIEKLNHIPVSSGEAIQQMVNGGGPSTVVSSTPAATVPTFATQEEAKAALDKGTIKAGQEIIVGGRKARF